MQPRRTSTLANEAAHAPLSDEFFTRLVEVQPEAVVVVDESGRIAHVNAAAEQLFGYRRTELVGHVVEMLLPQRLRARHAEHRGGFMRAPRLRPYSMGLRFDLWGRRRDGSEFAVDCALVPVESPGGLFVAAALREMGERDVYRRVVETALAGIWMIDEHGGTTFANGRMAQMLHTTVEEMRGASIFEFMGTESQADARSLLSRRDGTAARQHELKLIARDGSEAWTLVESSALTDLHGDPGGALAIVIDITERHRHEEELRERLAFEKRIRRAIEEERLLVYSQPIIDLRTGEPVQEELLVRMRGTRGVDDVVLPGEFLPQAEAFGLIGEIDRFMIDGAISMVAEGRSVAVNVSPRSIDDPQLTGEIARKLAAVNADAKRLTFEITETAAIRSPAVAGAFSADLDRLGCKLALDDFGTGFGSLTELKNLTVHYLKIDVSFVKNLATSLSDQRIVDSIVSIAREFGIHTIAEGIEDDDTLTLLRDHGVDYAQGFLIARPAPVSGSLRAAPVG